MKAIIASTFILYFLVTFAIQLLEVPTVRLFEIAICDRYYRTTNDGVSASLFKDIDESSCKITAVQNELAEIAGWKISFDAVPGLLTALWYGSIADRYGQRLVLLLSLTGSLMGLTWIVFICKYNIIFTPQLIWISSIFLFIGGGVRVFNSVIFSIISDSLGHSQRTKFLYLLAAGPHINRLITPRISTFLMGYSIYVPFWVAITIDSICLLMLLAWPYQNKKNTTSIDREEESESTDADSASDDLSNVNTPLLGSSPSPTPSPSSPIDNNNTTTTDNDNRDDQKLSTILNTAISLLKHPASRFCFTTYILKRIAFASEGFMFQYASEKFLWPLHQTTWLRVGQASGAILATLVLCPLIMSVFSKTAGTTDSDGRKRRCGLFPTHVIDLTMIRSALTILTLSFFAAWKAPSAVFLVIAMAGCGLGEGLEPALQGLITYLVDSDKTVRLFTTLAVCDTIAEFVGGPVTARLMEIGRRPGHASDGYCFLGSSMMFAGLLGYSMVIRARRSQSSCP